MKKKTASDRQSKRSFRMLVGVSAAFLVAMTFQARAQTTLSGDHVITGNLDVGTSETPASLRIIGPTGNQAAPALHVTGDGAILIEGTFGVGHLPHVTAGPRWFWHPKKAALRIGRMGEIANDADIAPDSIAMGFGSAASGENALGLSGGNADGKNAIALGEGSIAGPYSAALSQGRARGYFSTAMSSGVVGENTVSNTAMSEGEAYGEGSTAISGGLTFGRYSTAVGMGAWTSVAYCVALGTNCAAVDGDSENWVETDPVLIVGNGSAGAQNSEIPAFNNALVVYKNGDVTISKPQGDVLMGQFGYGPTEPQP
jgi:hypothetical protein